MGFSINGIEVEIPEASEETIRLCATVYDTIDDLCRVYVDKGVPPIVIAIVLLAIVKDQGIPNTLVDSVMAYGDRHCECESCKANREICKSGIT